MDNMRHLSAGAPANLELVPASDAARVEELLATTNALFIVTDDVGIAVNHAVPLTCWTRREPPSCVASPS